MKIYTCYELKYVKFCDKIMIIKTVEVFRIFHETEGGGALENLARVPKVQGVPWIPNLSGNRTEGTSRKGVICFL